MNAKVEWIDGGREPTEPPDPRYPNGIDAGPQGPLRLSSCRTALPYPAKRCGAYRVECETCGQSMLVTTAGRPDDPRSVTMICRGRKLQ